MDKPVKPGRKRVSGWVMVGIGVALASLLAMMLIRPGRGARVKGAQTASPESSAARAQKRAREARRMTASAGKQTRALPRRVAGVAGAGAAPADGSAVAPLGFEEIRKQRAEQRETRAKQHEEREAQRKVREQARREALLKDAAGDPERIERLKLQFAERDAKDAARAERMEQQAKERAERAKRINALGPAYMPPHKGPELGPPVIGPDGKAYDPRVTRE